MTKTYIQIIAFNIPFPANYGGVIDVFYRLKALHESGFDIHLHCFHYGRDIAEQELGKYCSKVYYYERKTNWLSHLSILPYNVYSRRNKTLLQRLSKCNAPILFEGLHSCYYISDPLLKDNYKIYRECNIEHDYYFHLFKSEKNIIKKLFFLVESLKFKLYENSLTHSNCILAISKTDTEYLRRKFPDKNIEWMLPFNPYIFEPKKDVPLSKFYVLYHGNLSVAENEKAALILCKTVFSKISDIKCIIAGLYPNKILKTEIAKYKNIELIDSPSETEMEDLIQNAGVHILYTLQATGIKLKLLHCLSSKSYVIANSLMIDGSGLSELCTICNNPEQMIEACRKLVNTPLSSVDIELRTQILNSKFSNKKNAERIKIAVDKKL